MKRIHGVLVCFGVVMTGGCATQSMHQMDADTRAAEVKATTQREVLAKHPEAFYQKVDGLWLGGDDPIKIKKGEVEPKALDAPIVFMRQYPVTLQIVAEWVTTSTGVPVVVTADAVQSASDTAYDPLRQLIARDGQPVQTQQATTATGAASTAGAGAFVISYQGTLRGLLNQVASRTGNAWLYRDGRVILLNTDTRVYQLHALPGTSKVSATVSNMSEGGSQQGGGGGGSGSSGGGAQSTVTGTVSSGQTTTVETTVEAFDSVSKTVTSMLSPKGKVVASASTGSVTVTDVPSVLDRVGTYIDQLNQQITRQVVIDARVYSVDVSNTESYGINWQLVWESMAGRYRVNTDIGGATSPDAGSISLGVIDNGFTYGGSQVLLHALSQQGNTSIATSAALATLSNQPVPVQVSEETTYLCESSTTLVQNAGAATTLTPCKVVTGFSMNVLPVVLDGNEVLLQLQISLSSLRSLREIASGDQHIEVPDVDARQILQRVKLMSGSTLVMGGFEQESIKTNDQGIGKPTFTLFGGSRNGTRTHTVLVITLTPRVIS